ncbi:TolC family protein, partial [Burkholderia territorii]
RAASARQGLANADAILAASRARLRQGVGTVVELAQATQNRAQANLALVQANGAESDGYLALVSALGISPLSKPSIAELPKRPLPPALASSVDAIVSDAIARRPDLQGAYALEQANRAKIKAAQAAFMPKIFLSASTSYASGGTAITALPAIGDQAATVNLNGSRYGGGVFVGVTIPLYDGGLRSAVLMQARNDAQSASERLTRTKEEAVRQVVAAQNAVQTSLASHDAAKALVDAAQTSYDAALTAYRNGVGSVTDATIAQSQLLAARNAEVDSYAGALSAAAALALATGTIGTAQ